MITAVLVIACGGLGALARFAIHRLQALRFLPQFHDDLGAGFLDVSVIGEMTGDRRRLAALICAIAPVGSQLSERPTTSTRTDRSRLVSERAWTYPTIPTLLRTDPAS